MKLIAKILVLPFILTLTLLVAVLSFLLCISGWLFSLAASLLALIGILGLITGWCSASACIAVMVMAFLISPFGLFAVADWLVYKLDDVNYSLKTFVTG